MGQIFPYAKGSSYLFVFQAGKAVEVNPTICCFIGCLSVLDDRKNFLAQHLSG